jgi:hypothetical protein
MYRYIAVPLVLFVLVASCSTAPKEVLVADMDPLDAGITDGGIMAYFPTRIRQIPLTVSFNPRNNMVVVQFRYQTVLYRQYWDPANRVRFIAAVERYHADYEARSLPERKRLRSRRAYDTLKSLTEWGTFQFTINARSRPQVYLGYVFHDNRPYFLVTQMPAKSEIVIDDDMDRNSLQIELYFTRDMAAALAQLFDQNYLNSLVPDSAKDRALQPGASIPADDYSSAPQADVLPPPVPGADVPQDETTQLPASGADDPQAETTQLPASDTE